MKDKVNVNWTRDMSFDALVDDHKVTIDAAKAVGGKERGPRPKPLLLLALGGCTGMDVVSILNKMRVTYEAFNIEVEGTLTEEHPKYYHTLFIRYIFKGKDLPKDKIEKAVTLSQEKYCGITAMLEKAAEVKHEVILED